MRTPSEQHDYLVKAGRDRFVDTYLKLFAFEAQGGRLPGITLPTRKQLTDFFESTSPGYWQGLESAEAQTQLQQWQKAV